MRTFWVASGATHRTAPDTRGWNEKGSECGTLDTGLLLQPIGDDLNAIKITARV